MFSFGIMFIPHGTELILIVLAVLLLFGATKVPQLMKGLGQGIKDFKSAVKSDEDDELTKLNEPKDSAVASNKNSNDS